MCVLEGPDLVTAALDCDVEIEAVYVDRSASERSDVAVIVERAQRRGVRSFGLDPVVFAAITDAQTPQPVLATAHFNAPRVVDLPLGRLVLVLHDVRDPGNVGTIIRSADASGAHAVVLTGRSVDPYNPKTLRATAGSAFRVAVTIADFDETMSHFESLGATTWATVVRGGLDLLQCDLAGPSVVVVGNEARGLDAVAVGRCQARLSIAMEGTGESLNAGVAASLIAFVSCWQSNGSVPSPARRSLGEL